jgi:hypothetical protein
VIGKATPPPTSCRCGSATAELSSRHGKQRKTMPQRPTNTARHVMTNSANRRDMPHGHPTSCHVAWRFAKPCPTTHHTTSHAMTCPCHDGLAVRQAHKTHLTTCMSHNTSHDMSCPPRRRTQQKPRVETLKNMP